MKNMNKNYLKNYSIAMTFMVILMGGFIFTGFKSNIDAEKTKKEIMRVDREFSDYSVKNGAKNAFEKYMTNDAKTYRNGKHIIEGKENFLSLFGSGGGTLKWEPFFADASESGDLGYTLGKSLYTSKDKDGKEILSYGYYITLWKKQSDGSWKFTFDTGIKSPPHEMK